MKKILISFFILSLTGFVLFIHFASRSTVGAAAYYQVRSYRSTSITKMPDTLSVMTYNIGYLSGMSNNQAVERQYALFRTNLNKASVLLNKLAPDIVGLQEVDFASSRSFDQNQLDSLAFSSDFSYSYRSINWDKRYVPFPYWPVSGQFGKIVSGQAILSHFLISNDTTIRLIKPVNASFVYKKFYLDRLIQICDVHFGEVKVKVINLHLEAFDEETRQLQAHVVKRVFETYADKMPVLLIGDFNSRPVSEMESAAAMKVIMQADYIASAVSDTVYRKSPEDYYTFSSGNPFQKIDHILYNKNYINNLESRVIREAGAISDHLPMLMKFTVKAE